ncbi:hypothetical protein [Haloferula sp. BvORR071]|uniref:hypothetical protein n=1 Tax=Haloferula sp. BvORR071 TaxID=1396141 RepID=UPI00054F6276|nr:hypothetical protein [Haloferula sp. BvORR071]
MESRIGHSLFDDDQIDCDTALDHHLATRMHLVKADVETIELFLEVIGEMAEESRGGSDEMLTTLLEEMPGDMGIVPGEDQMEDVEDPEFADDPELHPELRPELENRLDFLLQVLVDDILFFGLFNIDPDYAREQVTKIGALLRREPPETIKAFVSLTRKLASEVGPDPIYQPEKNLLLNMPYDLGLLADPR